jgi:large subunit ribosomal protein L19
MTTLLEKFNKEQERNIPDIRPGDTIKVHQKIKEGDKERIQIFEGVVLAKKHGKGISATITVRKVVEGVGVERVFPIHSVAVEKFEIIKHGKVRRSKLYYLRTAKGKKSRLKNKEFSVAIAEEPKEEIVEKTETPEAPVENKTEEIAK